MLAIGRTVFSNRVFKPLVSSKYSPSVCQSSTQTQPAIQTTTDHGKQLKEFETLVNITRKPRVKKPQKPPFAKNLFLGKFDTDILTYPDLEKEETDNLEKNTATLSKILKLQHMIDCKSLSDKHFRQNLGDHKVIGLQASQFLGGRECNVTEAFRFLEVLCEHSLGVSLVSQEQLGVQTLVKFANEKLQKKYLHQIMKGELLAAFCLSENQADIISFSTRAQLSKDGKTWTLNGEKNLVINGNLADVYLVFGITDIVLKGDIKEPKFTCFVVDRNFAGVTVTKNDMDTATVTFNQTPIPAENVIGEVNDAENMLRTLLIEFRLSSGPMCISLTKKMLNSLTKLVLEESDDTNLLYKTDAVRGTVGEIVTSLYAMESVVYLTTGLADNYENQDIELESAIVKIFSAEQALKTSMLCLDVIGPPVAVDSSHWIKSSHAECIRHYTLPQDNDSLKIISALLGLQHAGVELNDFVDKMRNPLFHVNFNLTRVFKDRRNISDNPKLDLRLGDYLHPSCSGPAQLLEYCVKRLEFVAEMLLVRHGIEVVNAHMELRRLADIIIDIYTMTACLGRASRAYCVGLQHAETEILLAMSFCNSARDRVRANVEKLYHATYICNDNHYRAAAKKLFKFKEYYVKHPLKRNF